MASWNDNWSNSEYSYYDDPCPYCGGPHMYQYCPSQTNVWNFCNECGCQGGHWDGCPNSYYPSQSFYCNVPNNVNEFDRSKEVEDMESMAPIMDLMRQLSEQQNLIAEQQALDDLAIKRLQATVDELKANLQAVPQTNEDSEFPPEDNSEEADIMSQSWLEEQATIINFHEFLRDGLSIMTEQLIEGRTGLRQEIDQFGSDIHDLQAQLNRKVEVSDTLPSIVVDTGQLVELKEEIQIFDQMIDDVKDDEEYKREDVKNNAVLELKRIGPHSKHFSTLCLVGDMEIDPVEHIEESMEEEQSVYILKFVMPRRQNDIPHLRAKKCKMRYLRFGSFIFIPPPHERDRKIDAKLGTQFISSKWKEKW